MTKLTAKQWSEFYYEQPYQLEQYFKSVDTEIARLRQQAATLADALETAKNQLEAVRKAGFKAASVSIAQHKAEAALAAYKESK